MAEKVNLIEPCPRCVDGTITEDHEIAEGYVITETGNCPVCGGEAYIPSQCPKCAGNLVAYSAGRDDKDVVAVCPKCGWQEVIA